MFEMAHNASQDALAAIGKIEQHEAVCAERWNQSRSSLQKLEGLPADVVVLKESMGTVKAAVGWGAVAMIGSVATIAWFFFTSFMERMDTLLAASKAVGGP